MNTKSSNPTEALSQIREIGAQFEATLHGNGSLFIEDYLRELAGLDTGLLFCELLAREIAFRRTTDGRPDVDSLRTRFSSLTPIVDALCREDVSPVERAHQIQNAYAEASQTNSGDQGSLHQKSDDAELNSAIAALLAFVCAGRGSKQGIDPFVTNSAADAGDSVADLQFSRANSTVPTGAHRRVGSRHSLELGSKLCGERFELLREIGAGGNGVVYEAFDKDRNIHVALKMLKRTDIRSVELFKREFRVLADVTHPNLVALYELFVVEPFWFLTMELVKGVAFSRYSRGQINPQFELQFDVQRLRSSALQLAQAIDALHRVGVLHRDLKSSNVLITDEGKVVVLDFGLAAILDKDQLHQVTDQAVAGTCAYMSPEQATGGVISPASDWYSFGTMLYEVLTGRLPFVGNPLQVLMDKQRSEPPAPRELDSRIPEDLNRLCLELLRRNPDSRPTGAEILQRLGADQQASSTTAHSLSTRGSQASLFVGRQAPLEELRNAFRAVRSGTAMNVLIDGSPGVGKSSLVRHFLQSLPPSEEVVVLSGRCYERESVPYKALDALVDSLAAYLASLPSQTAEIYLPLGAFALARVFPALRRIKAIADAARAVSDIPDQQELRRRAFRALRELLCRLGSKLPLILVIDDLQWGDVDSAVLLSEILRAPDAPVMLVIGTFRSEDINSPFLASLFQASQTQESPIAWQKLTIAPLSSEESRSLLTSLMGEMASMNAEFETIVRESRGNPFFVGELVHYLHTGAHFGSSQSEENPITLDRVLWSRISGLPAGAKRLIEVVAVSGRPLRLSEALRAAGVAAEEQLPILRTAHLVRATGTESHNAVECYHDCIRESIVAHIEPHLLKEYHQRLAMTLETAENPDPEHLALHFEGCDNRTRASYYYGKAAARAAELLAFDRAAQLYDRAIRLADPTDSEVRSLHVKRGDTLANAGRGQEASEAYLAATAGAEDDEKINLHRRAAEQFLISGHVDEGLELLRNVLESSGLCYPTTPKRALVRLLWYRLQLRLRGIGFRQQDAKEIPSEALSRIDTCWSVAVGLTNVDPIRASCFATYGLLLALKAGEPYRIARTLAVEAFHESINGSKRNQRLVDRMLKAAAGIAERINSPHVSGLIALSEAMIGHLTGNFRIAFQQFAAAEKIFREQCTGVSWELDTSQIYQIYNCFNLGDVPQLRSRVLAFFKEAKERGDLYAEMSMAGFLADIPLYSDDVEQASISLDTSLRLWSRPGLNLQSFTCFYSEAHFHLYTLNGSAAWAVARERQRSIRNSLLGRVQYIRIITAYLCGRCAVLGASEDESLIKESEKEASRILSERVAWGKPFATQLLAAAAARKGDIDKARDLFDAAARDFEQQGCETYAQASLRRYGELLGGEAGKRIIEQTDQWMRSRGLENPSRAAHIFAPQTGMTADTQPG